MLPAYLRKNKYSRDVPVLPLAQAGDSWRYDTETQRVGRAKERADIPFLGITCERPRQLWAGGAVGPRPHADAGCAHGREPAAAEAVPRPELPRDLPARQR